MAGVNRQEVAYNTVADTSFYLLRKYPKSQEKWKKRDRKRNL